MHVNYNNYSTVVNRWVNSLALKRETQKGRKSRVWPRLLSSQSRAKKKWAWEKRERTAGKREKKGESATLDICSGNSCKACLRSVCVCVCVCSDSALRLLDQKNWKKGHCIHPYLCLSCSLHPFLLTLAPHNSPNPAAHSEQTVPLSTVRVCVVFLYIFTLPHTSEVIWSCCICPSICIIYIVY